MLAPQQMKFYDKNWLPFGTRVGLAPTLSDLTRIPVEVLDGVEDINKFSVAQKMAWASNRRTTREEDIAYCLFGLFQINAPLLYGEGGMCAFQRLQEEIIKKTNDQTIFAWIEPDLPKSHITSMLAPSPRCFYHSGDITNLLPNYHAPEFKVTNKGLKIKTVLYTNSLEILMPLNCQDSHTHGSTELGISLWHLSNDMFFRSTNSQHRLIAVDLPRSEQLIYIAVNTEMENSVIKRIVTLEIPLQDGGFALIEVNARFDYGHLDNLFCQSLADHYFIDYDPKGVSSSLSDTEPVGRVNSFGARYFGGRKRDIEDAGGFVKACRHATFKVHGVLDTADVIFGRPVMGARDARFSVIS